MNFGQAYETLRNGHRGEVEIDSSEVLAAINEASLIRRHCRRTSFPAASFAPLLATACCFDDGLSGT